MKYRVKWDKVLSLVITLMMIILLSSLLLSYLEILVYSHIPHYDYCDWNIIVRFITAAAEWQGMEM